MIGYDELLELHSTLAETTVLTAYLAREGSDPGQAALWRNRLEADLARERLGVEERASSELPAFDAASAHVTESVSAFGRVFPHLGWWIVATAEGVQREEPLSFRPLPLVRWRLGVYAAPVVRALKGERLVAIALIDSRRARLFSYRDGELERAGELATERDQLDLSDMGVSKRSSWSRGRSGVRGETRTDAARHAADEAERDLRSRVVESLVEMANAEGIVLVGGAQKPSAALLRDLEPGMGERAAALEHVSMDVDEKVLLEAVEGGASAATIRRQTKLLEQASGTGSLGWKATRTALDAGAVDTLLLSRDLVVRAPEDADELVHLALRGRARVEELGGTLGVRLSREGEGVGARLRFRPGI